MSSSSLTYPCLVRDHHKQPDHHFSMFSLSSPLALKGQLKLNTTTTVLLVLFILTLYITSCEARHLRVHGKHSSKLPSSPSKDDVIEVRAAKEKMIPSMVVRVGRSIDAAMGKGMVVEAKKEVASSGGVRNTRHVVRVLKQLPRREHEGDSSRASLRKRSEGTKARSGMRERPVLGAESNSEQVGSNATTAYSAETVVAMDYLDAHPAPAVHNR